MKTHTESNAWLRLALVVLFVGPLLIAMMYMPTGPFRLGVLWLWLLVFVAVWLVWGLFAPPIPPHAAHRQRGNSISRRRGDTAIADATTPEQIAPRSARPRQLRPDEQPQVVHDVMDVHLAIERDQIRVFRGPLRVEPAQAYDRLKQALAPTSTPLLQEDSELEAAVVVLPVPSLAAERRSSRVWLNWLLFLATIATTLWAGAAYQGVNLIHDPARYMVGLPYAIGLMAILGVHEMGHFVLARRHRMDVTPPYFIPVPFALGTFGAFIQMRSPPENRRALFDVAVAGPLAGLAIAIPALVIGLQSSVLSPGSGGSGGSGAEPLSGGMGGELHTSILFAVIAKFSLGSQLAGPMRIQLSPLAFAGWLGLFITALNLLPVGQLDGGHMAYAMFGRHIGDVISRVSMWSLFLLALFVWPGLLVWAVIVFFIAGRHVPPLNDLTPITPARRVLGYITFVILALILTPMPPALWDTLARCPYL